MVTSWRVCGHQLGGVWSPAGGGVATTWRGCGHQLGGVWSPAGWGVVTSWEGCGHQLGGVWSLAGGGVVTSRRGVATSWRGCGHPFSVSCPPAFSPPPIALIQPLITHRHLVCPPRTPKKINLLLRQRPRPARPRAVLRHSCRPLVDRGSPSEQFVPKPLMSEGPEIASIKVKDVWTPRLISRLGVSARILLRGGRQPDVC